MFKIQTLLNKIIFCYGIHDPYEIFQTQIFTPPYS